MLSGGGGPIAIRGVQEASVRPSDGTECHPYLSFARRFRTVVCQCRSRDRIGPLRFSIPPIAPSETNPLHQILRIQRLQRLRHEPPVFADQLPIKMDRPAAVILPLDAHHVPVHLGAVSVLRLLIALPRSEME